ncbi:hypothetical protein K435DRAFT_809329 [Dendrothele bispora CBS 962.96]|uniref:Uncharacterized protein n=1 Tax=Dendrothele bispora (strain CBS 962.96) TaxID=1314807 RepID=A0A4S8KYM2_DENBC|nr:hypothetical protein K435DRAFT_809329 [Dendrothele bispora CBS 962.96]
MVPPQVLIQQAVLPQQLLDQQFVILQQVLIQHFCGTQASADSTLLWNWALSHPQVRQQLLRGLEPAGFENDEIEALFEKNVNRWNGADYFLRQDEMVGFTDLLNGLAVSKGSNCLFLANEYQTLGQRLIECGPDHSTDELEILKPEWFGPGTIYAQLIHYTTHFLSKPTSIHFFHLDNSKAHWVLFKVSSKSFKIDLFDSLSDGDWDEIVDIDSEEGMVAIASHFSGLQNYTQAKLKFTDKQARSCSSSLYTGPAKGQLLLWLKSTTSQVLKTLLGAVWISWRFSSHGLGTTPIQEFLRTVGIETILPQIEPGYCAIRPPWLVESNITQEIPINTKEPSHEIMQEEVDSMPALEAHQQTRGEKLVVTKKSIQNFQHATGIQLNLTSAKKIWNNEYKSFISEIQIGKEFNIGGIKIQLKDLERLQRGWISDELITLFLLMTRSAFEERHVYVVDSLFWKKLEQLILPYGSDHKKGWKDSLMRLVMKNPVFSVIKDGAVEATTSDKNNVGTRLKTNEDSGGTKYLKKTKQPGEVDHHKTNRRSSRLKGKRHKLKLKQARSTLIFPLRNGGLEDTHSFQSHLNSRNLI